MTLQLDRRDLAFLLYELLDADQLADRPRFAWQGREVYDAVLETARAVAEEHYAPFRKDNDQHEPELVGGARRVRGDAPVALQPRALVEPEHGLGVADIQHQEPLAHDSPLTSRT